jgi:hypothetical protein
MFEEIKKPTFIDLVYGSRGTWINNNPASGEGLVVPEYIPEGRVRKRDYPYKVPKEAVVKISPSQSFPGVPNELVILTDTVNDERPVLNELDVAIANKLSVMRQRIEEANWRASRERRERKTVEDRTEHERSKRDLDRRRTRRPPEGHDMQN